MLYIEKTGMVSSALNALKRLAAFRNPDFYKAQAMRLSTHDKARIISCSDETEQYLCLPRGLENEVRILLEDNGVNMKLLDETNEGRMIDVLFNGELRGEQQQAADALLTHNIGLLSATTAFGKTVIGAYLIAKRKVNTLVLVHRVNLMDQWIDSLNKFLIINEEPVVDLTPTGRERKKFLIGQIGGGDNSPGGIIDIAVMQSLVSGVEVKDVVKNYGMVIVDECHYVSAFSFEQVMKAVNARYVHGLSATPKRKDGHHPIIYMHCGKIRYRVDAKEQAKARPFEHFIIPRFTRFRKPAHRGDNWDFADVYGDIQNSDVRNDLIIQDVSAAVEQGRNPIILTERTDHVDMLVSQLRTRLKNVIALTGGEAQKKSREALQAVASIPEDEPFVLVATGKYVGEGFDMPRLDTLFLAMPVSWEGTIQQYAGRLHRLYEGKKKSRYMTMWMSTRKSLKICTINVLGVMPPLDIRLKGRRNR
jgi:superfamily II DNA or RNA helicase